MALIKCPECGREISDKAVACVNCGFPIREFLAEQEAPKSETAGDVTGSEKEQSPQSGTGASSETAKKQQKQPISYIWLIAFLIIGMIIWQNYSPGAREAKLNAQPLKAGDIVGEWDYDGTTVILNSDQTIDFDGLDELSGKWTIISEDQNLIIISYTVSKDVLQQYADEAELPPATIYQYVRADKKLVNTRDEDNCLKQ